MELLFTRSIDMLCITGFDGYLKQVNPAWEKVLGYSIENLMNKSFNEIIFELVHPEDRHRSLASANASYYSDEIINFENRFKCKDGSYKWLSWNVATNKEAKEYYGIGRDITLQKEKEIELSKLTLFQEAILNSTTFSIISTDRNGVIQSFNKAASKNLGYEADEVIGKKTLLDFHDVTEVQSRAIELSRELNIPIKPGFEVLTAKARLGLPNESDWTYCRKDGTQFTASISITPLKDKAGNINGFLKIGFDRTEAKKTQEIIQEKELHLKAFVQHAPAPIAMFDSQMRYIAASERWLKEHNITTEDIFGVTHFKLTSDTDSLLEKIYEMEAEGNFEKKGEDCIIRPDGTQEWRAWEIHPWYKPDESKGGIILQIEDITERKLAKERLEKSRDYYLTILENFPDLIYRTNNKGKANYFNQTYLKYTGRTLEQELGDGWAESIYPDDTEEVYESYMKAFHAREPLYLEYRFRRYDGEYRWIIDRAVPIYDPEGNFTGYLGEVHDFTEKKLTRIELQAAKERAEKESLFKSRFLANMSHEMRTPLNAIIGFAEVLKKQDIKPEQQEHLQHITTAGDMLLKLIGDILDLNKIEVGKLSIENRSFHLREALSSALYPYKHAANEKGLQFSLLIDECVPAHVWGDADRIKQVIINLIGNALKFTKKGSIIVSVDILNPTDSSGEALIKISVADTGIGVPADKQNEIFESFTQVDDSFVRGSGGSGLGLSIVKQLVYLMGGEIKVVSPSNNRSQEGPGSTFHFILRLKVDNNRDTALKIESLKAPAELKFSTGVKILLVEDNFFNQKLAQIVLSNLGCEIDIANNGIEAVEFTDNKEYDVILMDIQMPVMDGYEATRIIRSKQKKTIPIIGLSANVYQEDIDNCLEAGMDDHLGKPYNELAMFTVLSKWLPKSQEEPLIKQDPKIEDEKYIDLTLLREITKGDKSLFKDMLLTFMEEKEDSIKKMKKALQEENWNVLSSLAHKMKSSVGLVGTERFKANVHSIETSCKQRGNLHKIPAMIDELEGMCYASTSELEKELVELEMDS